MAISGPKFLCHSHLFDFDGVECFGDAGLPPEKQICRLWRYHYFSYCPGGIYFGTCYNEGQNIVQNAQSLLSLHYGRFEVIVINDGSKDDTLEKLIQSFELEKNKLRLQSGDRNQTCQRSIQIPKHVLSAIDRHR
ncbi:glycosyltransferase [Algoriphagus boritolerans]|uniref:glycosyltransferase n=1 Tax=Algoriphagus boritolerans TaxID=308111 RepID=UPI002FCDE935